MEGEKGFALESFEGGYKVMQSIADVARQVQIETEWGKNKKGVMQVQGKAKSKENGAKQKRRNQTYFK